MRRRDVGEAGAGRAADAGSDIEAVAIDRDRRDARPGSDERRPGAGIAGILEPCRIARIEQHLAHQRQPVLRARDDDDLVRRAGCAADAAHVLGDLLAQREQSWAGRRNRAGRATSPSGAASPDASRRARGRGRAPASRGGRAAPAHRVSSTRAAWRPARRRGATAADAGHVAPPRPRERSPIDGQRIGDVGAGAGAGADQSFRGELIEGEHRGRARDPQILGQRSRGRQPRAGPQHAVADGAAKAGAQLRLERLAGPRVEAHQHLGGERAHRCAGPRQRWRPGRSSNWSDGSRPDLDLGSGRTAAYDASEPRRSDMPCTKMTFAGSALFVAALTASASTQSSPPTMSAPAAKAIGGARVRRPDRPRRGHRSRRRPGSSAATDRFKSSSVAIAEGYPQETDCVQQQPHGAMGYPLRQQGAQGRHARRREARGAGLREAAGRHVPAERRRVLRAVHGVDEDRAADRSWART